MTFDPTRALGRKENSLEFSDSKVSYFGGQFRIQRPVKSLGNLIFNEVGSGNISERPIGQRFACFSAHVFIACAADVQITLFELVGKHKDLGKLIAGHGGNRYGEMASVDVLLLFTPRNVTTNGRFPGGNPSGNLTIM